MGENIWEIIVCPTASLVPRLKTAPDLLNGLMRLHLHARGAMSNLFLEAQPAVPLLNDAEVLTNSAKKPEWMGSLADGSKVYICAMPKA